MVFKQRPAGGFTILEVLVALAITGFLLASAAALLGGQTGETSFQQSLRDIQTKLSDSVEGISGGLLPAADKYTCSTDGTTGRPKLTQEDGGFGSNQDCIYLGKAIQVLQGKSTIRIFIVLGNRTSKDNKNKTISVPTLADAKPTPATVSATGYELTEVYRPLGGAVLTAAKYANDTGGLAESALAGFYNDPAGADISSAQLMAVNYFPLVANGSTTEQVTNCVEKKNGCDSSTLFRWILCYQDGNNSHSAYIEVTPGSSGISTQLRFDPCPTA